MAVGGSDGVNDVAESCALLRKLTCFMTDINRYCTQMGSIYVGPGVWVIPQVVCVLQSFDARAC